jgi:succinyl-CoA synthetase beta subunit
MTRLAEFDAKEILRKAGIRTPDGRLCTTSAEALQAAREIEGPWYVKAQVPVGDRAALDAIRAAELPESVEAYAADMLSRTFEGLSPSGVLVERAIAALDTFYCAIRVDDIEKRRVLVFERGGGSGFNPEESCPLLVLGASTEGYEIRSSLRRRGLHSSELVQLTDFCQRLVGVAESWHTYVVEVNPLFLTADGVVAVDAKMELDDYSAASYPEPIHGADMTSSPREEEALRIQSVDHRGTFRFVQLVPESDVRGAGLVGSHAVGGGESMVILDALASAGLSAANYCDTSGSPSREKVAAAARLIASQTHIEGYFFSSCIANQPLSVTAGGLVDGFVEADWKGPTVIRIAGNEEDEAIQIVESWGADVEGPVRVFGRDTDEWSAAAFLAELLKERHGVSH